MMTPRFSASLLRQLLVREIQGRYRGSALGLAWSFVLPLFMLAIYTFVFGTVFSARWPNGHQEGTVGFALALFAGLIVFNCFAEAMTRAPSLITAHPNYVKKVAFPLELLPVSAVGAALFHAAMSLAVLLGALVMLGRASWWWLALPLSWLPFALLTLGLTWLLASLGVFLRDLAQVMGPAVSALLFLSPVFYPLEALPPALQPWLQLNPLTVPIEATRQIAVFAQPPAWGALALYGLFALAVAAFGYLWFTKTKKGFADVL